MSGATDQAVAGARRAGALAAVGYAVLLVACAVLSLTWLVVGAVVGVAAHVPSVAARLAAAAADGSRWAQGVLDAVPRSEPAAQAVLDYGFSVLSIGIAIALLAAPGRGWSNRLLALAMVGSAGAFNLQAHAAATAVETASGLSIGGLHQVLLHGVACAAYILALMMFPPDRETRPAGSARTALILAGTGTLLLVGFGTALLPHTTSCVLFFGFLVPLVGLVVLPRQIRDGTTAEARTQARLLFSVLAAAFAVTVVLAIITLLLWSIGWTGLVLVDPTAHPGEPGRGEPIALLFWFARLACIAIAVAVLVATRRVGLWTAEHIFSRGLAAVLAAALVGGGYVVVRTTAGFALDDSMRNGAVAAAALATGSAALAFLPVYLGAERLADRLLYGTRPTPYSVLAGVAALSRVTSTDAPDLARVAEAVGRGLGATTCRLTVTRPGLRDRSYTWAEPGADVSGELVEVGVLHGAERIGTIAVDHGAVAGLHGQRQHLLEDIADSLGVVLQASRFGIELERQLRAALAHANEIAASRRAVVAEMDGERRRIERDLHDGAQHHLVSLRLALGLVEHQVSTAQFDQARARLDQIADQIDTAESILAETATGVSSPLLAEIGLVRALDEELGGGGQPVTIDSGAMAAGMRFPPDVEAAAYFCCLEAVNNARKHAPGAAIGVRLGTDDGHLHFAVRDDGPGWEPTAAAGSAGRGLHNLTVRIAAVGGRIEIRSAPGAGTTVEGSVPLPQPAAVPAAGDVPAGDAPARTVARVLGRPAAGTAGLPLEDQVRDAVRAAREAYHGTTHAAPLRALAERLDGPLRIAVAGPPASGASALVEALDALEAEAAGELPAPAPARAVLIDVPRLGSASPDGPPAPGADAFVLVLRQRRPDDVALFSVLHRGSAPHRPAHAIGVLALADEPAGGDAAEQSRGGRGAADHAARPEVRRLCHTVVPVAPLLARAATTLRDAEYRTLRRWTERDDAELERLTSVDASPDDGVGAGRGSNGTEPVVAVSTASPGSAAGAAAAARRSEAASSSVALGADEVSGQELLDRFGPMGVRLAVESIRSGQAPTAAALAAVLVQRSGLPRLRELIASRLTCRADALKARSVLLALESVVRSDPPPDGGGPLRYQLDRVRSGAHELTEIDVVDALRAGELGLADEERRQAEQLLGAGGTEPRIRLALAPDAGREEVARAAAEQLARWQRRGAHPLSDNDTRNVAAVLVHTCERLLARAAER